MKRFLVLHLLDNLPSRPYRSGEGECVTMKFALLEVNAGSSTASRSPLPEGAFCFTQFDNNLCLNQPQVELRMKNSIFLLLQVDFWRDIIYPQDSYLKILEDKNMLDQKVFGEKLRNHRKRLGMTQEEVAEKICVSPQAISKWESGVSHN